MKLAWLLWLVSLMPASVQDRACLATTVYLEARDQPAIGQLAVAEVALRRRANGRDGATVCSVVLKSKQFAPGIVSQNYRIRLGKAWDRAWDVAGNALAMWNLPADRRREVVPGADHFYAHNLVTPKWAQGQPVAVIGDHAFFAVGL
jgi:spore germination cell wall hydrolase CwlJ-like protein